MFFMEMIRAFFFQIKNSPITLGNVEIDFCVSENKLNFRKKETYYVSKKTGLFLSF